MSYGIQSRAAVQYVGSKRLRVFSGQTDSDTEDSGKMEAPAQVKGVE